jgi:hypothetical protein
MCIMNMIRTLIFFSNIFRLFEFGIFVTPHGNALLLEGLFSFVTTSDQQRVPRRC